MAYGFIGSVCFILYITTNLLWRADAKLVQNHIDWKSDNGETMVYAIKTVGQHDMEDEDFMSNLLDLGLVYTSHCLYIDSCHVFTHTYHVANGSCTFSNTTCAPTVKSNKEVLHSHLDSLDRVEWYAEIWERHRFKRRMYFNDRNYTLQWHLVSVTMAVVSVIYPIFSGIFKGLVILARIC